MQWAVYIITAGAVTALCASLMGSLLPQPRMFMAMARDGLLPSFFSDIDKHTQVPVKSTIVIGILATALAFFMDVSQLAGMVSVGTILAFTAVAVSVLILRYVPPDVVPLASSFHESIDASSPLLLGGGDVEDVSSLKFKDPVKFFDHGRDVAPSLRVSVWLLIGAVIYLFYGRTHSSLMDAVYVPNAYADKVYRASSSYQ
ncbi:unnamed protein product, partial [Linum tenue]